MLRAEMGCRLVADPSLRAPAWLSLPPAVGSEPVLDLSREPRLDSGIGS
jgi:hypothetical protein